MINVSRNSFLQKLISDSPKNMIDKVTISYTADWRVKLIIYISEIVISKVYDQQKRFHTKAFLCNTVIKKVKKLLLKTGIFN